MVQNPEEAAGTFSQYMSHLGFEAIASKEGECIGQDDAKANMQDSRLQKLTRVPPNTELKKKRTFRKFSYRGIDLDQYVFLSVSPSFYSTRTSAFSTLCVPLPSDTDSWAQTPRPLLRTITRCSPCPSPPPI